MPPNGMKQIEAIMQNDISSKPYTSCLIDAFFVYCSFDHIFCYGVEDSLSIFSSAVFINTCIIIPKEMYFSAVIFIMHLFLFLLQKNNFLSFFVTGCNRRYLIWNKSLLFYFVARIDISSETSQQE